MVVKQAGTGTVQTHDTIPRQRCLNRSDLSGPAFLPEVVKAFGKCGLGVLAPRAPALLIPVCINITQQSVRPDTP